MYNPISTYRFQFHTDFTFSDFKNILDYIHKLGVKTIYASPIFSATPGSNHGYDTTNPHEVNPEIGTLEEWQNLHERLSEYKLGWLQDIVPNHMALHPNNDWLMDVLEKGERSRYYSFFDVDWNSTMYPNKLMIPFLGKPSEEAIQEGELQVAFDNGRFVFQYFENVYPLHYRSYPIILQHFENQFSSSIQEITKEIQKLDTIAQQEEFDKSWTAIKNQLAQTYHGQPITLNQQQLQHILQAQNFVLSHWKETEYQINYRRFFTVNSLICLRMEEPEVFQHYHQFIKKLLDNGLVQGLRIDHIDGLNDPTSYLKNLRKLVGKETYIVVEKILEHEEDLPKYWPIQGNTGYDFLAIANNLFTYDKNERIFERFYRRMTDEKFDVEEEIHNKKAFILHERMAGELANLVQYFKQLELSTQLIEDETLKEAISEFLIGCSVYRFYGNEMPLPEDEATEVQAILQKIRRKKPHLREATELLSASFLNHHTSSNGYAEKARQFFMRCMQFTGPLMAKGVEDTLMYVYNRFIAHNEVGDAPDSFGISVSEFHQQMQRRQADWPLTLNATSTHDTKRGEDVRARLNVLSELPTEWQEQARKWHDINVSLKEHQGDLLVPDDNDEYLIYQTLLGIAPMNGQPDDSLLERLKEYIGKALREAKVHTNWSEPNEDYEAGVKRFLEKIVDTSSEFWRAFQPFQQQVAALGSVNSLSQVLLKFTCPGVPDVYQGCELWNFSLVDPDNRRPVDYELMHTYLTEVEQLQQQLSPKQFFQQLWQERNSGKIKFWLTYRLLQERQTNAELFETGDYIPLKIEGKYKNHVLAFARKAKGEWLVTAIPLYVALLSKTQHTSLEQLDWADTRIVLPEGAPTFWENRFTNLNSIFQQSIPVAEAFADFSGLLLKGRASETERGAGILLHITSLPSGFGIGDLGPEAYKFADFLFGTRQKYWQVLPLSPIGESQHYSPYSSVSGFAGNVLLLSPERLIGMGLLSESDLTAHTFEPDTEVHFAEAETFKHELFVKVYANFKRSSHAALREEFLVFCKQEKHWLDDYALYIALKQEYDAKPWYEWPQPLKNREAKALAEQRSRFAEAVEQEKVLQFLVAKQWQELKYYCNGRGIQLFGDLPFYLSYDSADVWAYPQYFSLNAQKEMTAVAGVPPDYFNENGQLWGMPVYRWDALRAKRYDWWVHRLQKNLEYFDLLRLDHFRAFSEYWEVPVGEKTAINGNWKPGLGKAFFKFLQKQLGKLPLVAEDLGDITDDVYALRDEFHLPGMSVLQFAFGENMATTPHAPHNFSPNAIAYTGTHDNNTTKGWFRTDLDEASKNRLSRYAGKEIDADNCTKELIRLAYRSVAKTVIIPLQDLLNYDETARMNEPSTIGTNWGWRLEGGELTDAVRERLLEWVGVYGRY